MGDSGGEQVLADLREGHVRDVMARLVTRKDLLSYCSPEVPMDFTYVESYYV